MESGEGTSSFNYRLWLMEELSQRTRRNPAYSLAAFSKSLGISAPSLSQIISGKRPLSRKAAARIIERCSLSPEEAQKFLASAFRAPADTIGKPAGAPKASDDYETLQIDTFRIISDWFHAAILSLGDIRGAKARPEWIADKLEISTTLAREAFKRLRKLGLLKKRGTGFHQCSKPYWVPGDSSNSALREYHLQNLEKAQQALEERAVPLEYFSSITMAVSESNLPKARERLRKFRREMCQFLEKGNRERVYTLSIQLFPVSKKVEER